MLRMIWFHLDSMNVYRLGWIGTLWTLRVNDSEEIADVYNLTNNIIHVCIYDLNSRVNSWGSIVNTPHMCIVIPCLHV
jgi:hypothetical protein